MDVINITSITLLTMCTRHNVLSSSQQNPTVAFELLHFVQGTIQSSLCKVRPFNDAGIPSLCTCSPIGHIHMFIYMRIIPSQPFKVIFKADSSVNESRMQVVSYLDDTKCVLFDCFH